MIKKIPFLFAIILLLNVVCSSFVAANEPEKLNILSLGDSITFGYGLEEPTKNAFPYLIANGASEVENISFPGWTSTELLTEIRKEEYTPQLQQADVITLYIGANDLMRAVELTEILHSQQPVMLTEEIQVQIGLATQALAENLKETIKHIRTNTEAPILIYSIYNPFAVNTENAFAGSLHMMGEQITTIVNSNVISQAALLPGIYYLDAYSAFAGKQAAYVIPGDIHPTVAGHQALAQLATTKIVELQPKELIIELTLSTEAETTEPVVVTIGEIADVEKLKWLPGEKGTVDFANAGNDINGNKFEVSENGKYTIYVKTTNQEAVTTIEIKNIKTVPDKEEEPVVEEPPTEQPEENKPTTPVGKPEPVEPTPEKVGQEEQEQVKAEETSKVEKPAKPIVKSGHTLPNTATSIYSFLITGLCLIVVGSGVLMIQWKRKTKVSNTL
ncbi:SGNH/GDSL hydrolase family protein [Metabacillus sp. FJAT-53654]|uniref:GDSL-type esterase/lipase family protein n=1 Tax=Metabacillus rhizosphaerae TaxID=3117747 RepID=A0ABZ2MZ55_9BACI